MKTDLACAVNKFLQSAPDELEENFEQMWPYDINKCYTSNGGKFLLHSVSPIWNFHVIEFLLQQPSLDVNVADPSDGSTALHSAVEMQNEKVVRSLLKRNDINVNPVRHDGITPFGLAGGACEEALLADSRTDVNVLYGEDITKLHMYFLGGYKFQISRLLKHPSIDVNVRNTSGHTPLSGLMFHNTVFPGETLPIKVRHLHHETIETFVADERAILAYRDNEGKNLMEQRNGICDEHLAIIRPYERARLNRAKRQVRVLNDWSFGDRVVDPGVLESYVLPYVADVLSPFSELGGSRL